ncbi:MAG: ribokinase [Chloroflexi bacterium]|nr:ribokinase [Chloroflexota bacterium]
MLNPAHFEAIDYLVIGHLSNDQTPDGPRLGGTAAFSSLTALALGLRVGIVTIWGEEIPLTPLQAIPIAAEIAPQSTCFENIQNPIGRQQFIHHIAQPISWGNIPEAWRAAPIVHLGPIAKEVETSLVKYFPDSHIYITAQGWLRDWDEAGLVFRSQWPEASFILPQVDAAVISVEDVAGDEKRIEEMAEISQVLVVTEGANGARVYWGDELRHFPAPLVDEVDSTGAGDIFASAFFVQLHQTGNPWIAAEFANHLAALSVAHPGLDGILINFAM